MNRKDSVGSLDFVGPRAYTFSLQKRNALFLAKTEPSYFKTYLKLNN